MVNAELAAIVDQIKKSAVEMTLAPAEPTYATCKARMELQAEAEAMVTYQVEGLLSLRPPPSHNVIEGFLYRQG